MSKERIFSGLGTRPAKGMHPVVGMLTVAYIIFTIFVLATYGLKNVRVIAPGPLLIFAAQRSTRNREGEPIAAYVDKVGTDEIYFGYLLKEKQKEYFIEEFSYWYYRKEKAKSKEYVLVLKINSVWKKTELGREELKETIFLTEEIDEIPNESWQFAEITPDTDNDILKIDDLAKLTVAIENHSS